MKLLILITGKAETILKASGLNPEDFHVVKIDEKDLAKPRKIMKLIKSGSYDEVFFGTIELELQRFQFFMFLYIFLTTSKGRILDSKGATQKALLSDFIFVRIPLFGLEVLATAILIPYYYIKYPFMQWKLRR